jgi:hypothetical protein
MERSARLCRAIVVTEAALLLLPTTLLYIGGMFFASLGVMAGNRESVNPLFLGIVVALLVPGYGLFGLWWLVWNCASTTRRVVPRHIWGGLAAGVLVALLFSTPYITSGLMAPTPYISSFEKLETMLLFGGGPIVVLITILVVMWMQEKRSGSSHGLERSRDG